jgi:hypothetical protein
VIAGHDPRDATSLPAPVPRYRDAAGRGVRGLRVGVPAEYFGAGLDPEVGAAVEAAIDVGRPRKIRVTDLLEQVGELEEERWVAEAGGVAPRDAAALHGQAEHGRAHVGRPAEDLGEVAHEERAEQLRLVLQDLAQHRMAPEHPHGLGQELDEGGDRIVGLGPRRRIWKGAMQLPFEEQLGHVLDRADLAVDGHAVDADLVGHVLHAGPGEAVATDDAGEGVEVRVLVGGRGRRETGGLVAQQSSVIVAPMHPSGEECPYAEVEARPSQGDAEMPETFLSDAWFTEVDKIRAEAGDADAGTGDLQLNIVVTGGPEGDKEMHLNNGAFERGLVDGAPTKVTVPFEVAKAMFVEGNQSVGMQAFMSGQIKIEGDMSKLMAMQGQAPSASQEQVTAKIKDITA